MRTTTSLLSLIVTCALACSDDTSDKSDGPKKTGDAAASDASAGDGPATDKAPGGDGGASTGPLKCKSYTTPSFSRACGAKADCVVALHTTDCCGTIRALGINKGEKATFDVEENKCAATYPACGCAPGPTETDDGSKSMDMTSSKFGVECVANMCTSYVEGCGGPCTGGLTCKSCMTKGTWYHVCSEECTSHSECDDPKLPRCEESGFGDKFCSADVGCGAR